MKNWKKGMMSKHKHEIFIPYFENSPLMSEEEKQAHFKAIRRLQIMSCLTYETRAGFLLEYEADNQNDAEKFRKRSGEVLREINTRFAIPERLTFEFLPGKIEVKWCCKKCRDPYVPIWGEDELCQVCKRSLGYE